MLGEFQVNSQNGIFHCSVHPPLAISLKAFRHLLPDRALPVCLLKAVLKHLLISLDFLHTEAKVIHTGTSNTLIEISSRLSIAVPVYTDIQESNILLGMNEETAEQDLEKFEKDELTSPVIGLVSV